MYSYADHSKQLVTKLNPSDNKISDFNLLKSKFSDSYKLANNDSLKLITSITGYSRIKHGEEMLTVLSQPANDYIDKIQELVTEPFSAKSAAKVHEDINKINQLPFFIWISKQTGFEQAREKLIDAKLINTSNILQYGVEFIIANVICHCAKNIVHFK